MIIDDLTTAVSSVVLNALATFINFIPSLVGGLIILIIGLVVAAVVYRVIVGFLKIVQLEKVLMRYGISDVEGKEIELTEILAEVVRWTIIIVFLVPTFEALKLNAINTVLNRVILFLPNVVVAVVLAMIGLVLAKLGYKVGKSMSRTLGKELSNTVGLVAEWSIVVFVGFLVLHQLGVAQELLRILFGGIVAMIALAGGLAFGLGGQNTARQILDSVWEKFKK